LNKIRILSLILLFAFSCGGCSSETEIGHLADQSSEPKPKKKAALAVTGDAPVQAPQSSYFDALPRQNPFLSTDEESSFENKSAQIPLDYLTVSAIMHSPKNKSKAIINGQVYEVGDIIDNKQVITINAEDVILKDTQGEYIIKIEAVVPGEA
jgi:hypothetical protein